MQTALSPQLSSTEKVTLLSLEETIQRGLQTFYEVGSALAEIRDSRLYREGYATFEDYCRDRWEMARQTAYQFIGAAEVFENVRHGGHVLPENERQTRPLAPLEPEQQVAAWNQVVETAPGGKVTAAHVTAVVERLYKSAAPKTDLDEDDEWDAPPADVANIDAALTRELFNRLQQGEPASQIVSSLAKRIDRREKEARRESFAARQQARAALFTEPIPFDPNAQYNVIYCDPPWRYEHSKSVNREIENHYPTMELADIKALQVPAASDCILFMWATSPKLAEAMEVLAAWGFTYRTCAVWVKDQMGMGFYFRQQHELLLVGKKGNMAAPEVDGRVSSVINAPRQEHSAKPVEVYQLIEDMYPEGKMLEVFARSQRVGWASYGNQELAYLIDANWHHF